MSKNKNRPVNQKSEDKTSEFQKVLISSKVPTNNANIEDPQLISESDNKLSCCGCEFSLIYSNPCCCFKVSLNIGCKIVAVTGLVIGTIFMFVGVIFYIFTGDIVHSLISADVAAQSLELKEASKVVKQVSGVYFIYGAGVTGINIWLIFGIKKQSRIICLAWALGKNVLLLVLVFGLIAVLGLIDTTIGLNSEGNSFQLLLSPVLIIPFDFYFFTVVSMYAVKLKDAENQGIHMKAVFARAWSLQRAATASNTTSSQASHSDVNNNNDRESSSLSRSLESNVSITSSVKVPPPPRLPKKKQPPQRSAALDLVENWKKGIGY